MFLSDFFFFCQSTATVLILRYCLMNTALRPLFFLAEIYVVYLMSVSFGNVFSL